MFRGFDELLRKKLQKVAHFVKKHEKSSIWPKLATFRANIMFQGFHELFGIKCQKVAILVKKHEKSSIWPNLVNFRENYHLSRFL